MQVHFSDDDRKVYGAWLWRTVLVYGALILLGLGMVSVLVSMKAGSVAEFNAGAIGMAAP
jgi:hypothetical protein